MAMLAGACIWLGAPKTRDIACIYIYIYVYIYIYIGYEILVIHGHGIPAYTGPVIGAHDFQLCVTIFMGGTRRLCLEPGFGLRLATLSWFLLHWHGVCSRSATNVQGPLPKEGHPSLRSTRTGR